jgi:hypothetical protein
VPALDHTRVAGSKTSVVRVVQALFLTSTLRTLPLGRSVNAASELASIRPFPPVVVHFNVAGSRIASSSALAEGAAPTIQRPSASTTAGASPIWAQSPAPPDGGEVVVQVFCCGS